MNDVKKWYDFHMLLNKLGLESKIILVDNKISKKPVILFGRNSSNQLVYCEKKSQIFNCSKNKKYKAIVQKYDDGLLIEFTNVRTDSNYICLEGIEKILALETGYEWKILINSNVWRRRHESMLKKLFS